MKLSTVSLLLSILSIVIVPTIVIMNFSLFGVEKPNLELMHVNFLIGLIVYVVVVVLSAILSLYVLVYKRGVKSCVMRAWAGVIVLLVSLVIFGPTMVSSFDELNEIGKLLEESR